MAFTLAELRSRLEKMTGTENDRHFTTNEKNEMLRAAAAGTWDICISSGLAERFVKKVNISITAGTTDYDLTDDTIVPDEDFYRISQVYVNEDDGTKRPLDRVNPAEIQSFRAPQQNGTLQLCYIRKPPSFKTNGAWDNGAELDVPDGVEEHTIATAARQMMWKKDDDESRFLRKQKEIEARIQTMGNVDFSQPARVVKRWNRKNWKAWRPYNNTIACYVVRANKLEVYGDITR